MAVEGKRNMVAMAKEVVGSQREATRQGRKGTVAVRRLRGCRWQRRQPTTTWLTEEEQGSNGVRRGLGYGSGGEAPGMKKRRRQGVRRVMAAAIVATSGVLETRVADNDGRRQWRGGEEEGSGTLCSGGRRRSMDVAGKPWRFRYSYWNSSQSYVLTKDWSRFVKEKKLDVGDVVLFESIRAGDDRLYIGCWRQGGEESLP
ncbi:hypothetical protein BHM03_00048773 [Ensete ventricosum]|nr:hypothetical protein BHM03_00048773 [Ensete ventricosum]